MFHSAKDITRNMLKIIGLIALQERLRLSYNLNNKRRIRL